jgi:hypothetical protein
VLYAVKGALGDDGLEDFLAWSSKSRKDVPERSEREYRAAKPTKIGAGTIYYLAQQYGWHRPSPVVGEPDPWPDPVNLFAELTAAPFEASDVPPELGEYPRLFAEQTGIDLSIMLTAAVVAAATAIPDHMQVCAAEASRWFTQPRLWALVIGAPGAGKSPGQREMLRPLWKIHSERDSEWRESVKRMEREAKENSDARPEPKPPRPRVIVGDTTLRQGRSAG